MLFMIRFESVLLIYKGKETKINIQKDHLQSLLKFSQELLKEKEELYKKNIELSQEILQLHQELEK